MSNVTKADKIICSMIFAVVFPLSMFMAWQSWNEFSVGSIDGSTYELKYNSGSSASAVAIGPRLLLTAGHVAKYGAADEKLRYTVYNWHMNKPLKATTLWANKQYDLGMLMVDEDLPYTSFVSCKTPRIGDSVSFVGFPVLGSDKKAQGPIFTKGVISSKIQIEHLGWSEWVAMDAKSSFGGSGGPVFNSKGNIAGVFVGVFGETLMYGDDESEADAKSIWIPAASGLSVIVPGSTICKFIGAS